MTPGRDLRLMVARKRLGLTQGDLAKRIGASRARVANWESGRTKPDRQTQLLIAETVGIARPEIFSD